MTNAKLSSLPALLVAAMAVTAPTARAATLGATAATDLNMEAIAEGLGEPMDIAVLPDGRVVIIQREGAVAIGMPGATTEVPIATMRDGDVFGEQGLLGIVADPNFATNHYLYIFVSMDADQANRHKIVRYTLTDDDQLTEQMILVQGGLAVASEGNHNGGGMIVDGAYLYISLGDNGYNMDPITNRKGQCLNKANGKILRVNLADGTAPADNPLMGVAMATGCGDWNTDFIMTAPDPRVFAWGLRNPFRFWVDPETKNLWVGDVGYNTKDEISIGENGSNFGWPFIEGDVDHDLAFEPAGNCQGVTPAKDCTPAVHAYRMAPRNAIIGGLILDICGWPDAWKSRYVFGDHGPNASEPNAWTLEVDGTREALVSETETEFGRFAGPVAFRVGPDHALYVVEHNGGAVQKITPKQATGEVCDAPVGGAGGTGGTGGAAGGSAGGGGVPPGGTGGAAVGGGGAGNVGGSGTTGTAGTGNPATPPAATSADEGGCGCRAARSTGVPAGVIFLAGALGLFWGRRRARRELN